MAFHQRNQRKSTCGGTVRPSKIAPTGVERTFDKDEFIVSKTDTKGIIRYANDVFLQISGYTEAELIGQPHSIVRHPQMPRAVFKLLWERIAEGHEVFAYINNLAKDGAHYWVLAHVTPSFSPQGTIIGYHSSRRKPAPQAVQQAQQLYDVILREQQRHSSPPQALQESYALLGRLLEEQHLSYDEYVWQLTPATVDGLPVQRSVRSQSRTVTTRASS